MPRSNLDNDSTIPNNDSTIPNPLGWPTYDKYKKSSIDLPPGEKATRGNNYGNLDLPEIPLNELKPIWSALKETTGFNYELFHSGNLKLKELPRNAEGYIIDVFGKNNNENKQNKNPDNNER